MIINFKRVHIHHFLSFDDSTIDLKNKGYCLVVGINKNPKDAAKSNGSGKSTIWNAISYALVGETLNGLKSNLSNNYFNDGCYVELEFEIDSSNYKLIRSKDDSTYGTNLKIYINDEDKSGKGIRESQALLDQYLPDITLELIGSVMMLGQGLPQKFTSNSPSGRKEVLEHLSKSDFMIQDLKSRIDSRISKLNETLRIHQDALLSQESRESVYKEQLQKQLEKFDTLKQVVDFDSLIAQNEEKNKKLTLEINGIIEKQASLLEKQEKLNEHFLKQSEIKQTRLDKVHSQYVTFSQDIYNRKALANSDKLSLTQEIKRLKEIKDVCPTCGQKIPNVIKPDTTQQEKKLIEIENLCNSLDLESKENDEEYNKAISQINNIYEDATKELSSQLKDTKEELDALDTYIKKLSADISNLEVEKVVLTTSKQTHEKDIKEVSESIETLNKQLDALKVEHETTCNQKLQVESHLEVVNKMNTLIKRDFRGILLSNVIKFINDKAKEYCSKIFNTDAIEFKLDGNNLDIIYDNKDYENLSGGEKARIDIIVQFSIREMMSQYLNFSSNILVLDEITDALDSISCDRVLDFITNELNDVESVFIISHHADELAIGTDCELIVEKNELGVSEVK